jgi:hypothetical protein
MSSHYMATISTISTAYLVASELSLKCLKSARSEYIELPYLYTAPKNHKKVAINVLTGPKRGLNISLAL